MKCCSDIILAAPALAVVEPFEDCVDIDLCQSQLENEIESMLAFGQAVCGALCKFLKANERYMPPAEGSYLNGRGHLGSRSRQSERPRQSGRTMRYRRQFPKEPQGM
jgi:hypothetical protein